MMIMDAKRSGWGAGSARNIPLSKKYHYQAYVMETLKRRTLPWRRVSEGEVEHIHQVLLQHFAATAENDAQFVQERCQIDKTWPTVKKYMRECPGLARFMLEVGAHSRFFYPFLLDIPRGIAMLPAFFYGRDIFGKIVPIPSSDPMYQFCLNDPVFKSVRFRNEYEQKYLMSAIMAAILAGGLLPQLWYGGYDLDPGYQKITVYDPDVGLQEPLSQIFGDDLSKHGITYHFSGFDEAFADESQWGKYDFVSAMGLASYHMKDLDSLLRGKIRMLAPGGILIFDLQLMVLALIFDKFVLHWETDSPMKPVKSVAKAVDYVSSICRDLGVTLEEYVIEPEDKAGVVFRISK